MLDALFKHVGAPVEFDALVDAFVLILNVTDHASTERNHSDESANDLTERLHEREPSIASILEQRSYLARLWNGSMSAARRSAARVPTAVFGVPDTLWTELALNWNNKPTPTLPELTRLNIPDATARWYEFDITNFVNAKLGAGEDAVSLLLRNMLRGEAGDFYTTFNSREAAQNQPQLVIERQAAKDKESKRGVHKLTPRLPSEVICLT